MSPAALAIGAAQSGLTAEDISQTLQFLLAARCGEA
jgi:hypothetical protein